MTIDPGGTTLPVDSDRNEFDGCCELFVAPLTLPTVGF